MSLPIEFKPKKNYSLIRLGRNNDGGYLIGYNTVQNAQSLISFGILDDCSFEKDFKNKNLVDIFCFDHTDYKSYWIRRIYNDLGASIYNFNFSFLKNTILRYFEFKKFFKEKKNFLFKKNIIKGSLKELLECTNLIKKPLLIKIDIEGSEYRLLDEILFYQKFLTGLVIEFHDVDLNKDKIIDFSNKLNLELVHIHANNFGGVDSKNNPLVLEISYSRNPKKIGNFPKIPNVLDRPNDTKRREVNLIFTEK